MCSVLSFVIGSLAKKATSLSIPLASLKFAPILAISHSSTRAKDWDDVLTAHADETFARSWTVLGKRLGKQTFGFADDTKGRGKVGSVKVVPIFIGATWCIVSYLLSPHFRLYA